MDVSTRGRESFGSPQTGTVQNLRDMSSCFKLLQNLANDLRTPLASVRLDRHGKEDKKMLFGTQSRIAAGTPSLSNQTWPADSLRTNIPDAASEQPGSPDVDELGGKTIFAIGSLVKLFINLAYCLVITRNEIDGVDWNVKACKLYNKICDARNEPRIPELERNPTLKELLLHKNGFAPMIRFLLAPDGTFMVSEAEFLRYAAPISNHIFGKQGAGDFNYSNANHIFGALLLEKIIGGNFSGFMRERIFDPLGMTRTTLDEDVLTE